MQFGLVFRSKILFGDFISGTNTNNFLYNCSEDLGRIWRQWLLRKWLHLHQVSLVMEMLEQL